MRLEMTGFRVTHTLCTRPLLRSVSYVYSWVNTRQKKKGKGKGGKKRRKKKGKREGEREKKGKALLSTSVLSPLPAFSRDYCGGV